MKRRTFLKTTIAAAAATTAASTASPAFIPNPAYATALDIVTCYNPRVFKRMIPRELESVYAPRKTKTKQP